MTFYLVGAVAWTCPGGWFSGLVPAKLKPLICDSKVIVEPFDRLARAQDRIDDLGQGASLIKCEGLRCRPLSIDWVSEIDE